jgi:hypothetical protein
MHICIAVRAPSSPRTSLIVALAHALESSCTFGETITAVFSAAMATGVAAPVDVWHDLYISRIGLEAVVKPGIVVQQFDTLVVYCAVPRSSLCLFLQQ